MALQHDGTVNLHHTVGHNDEEATITITVVAPYEVQIEEIPEGLDAVATYGPTVTLLLDLTKPGGYQSRVELSDMDHDMVTELVHALVVARDHLKIWGEVKPAPVVKAVPDPVARPALGDEAVCTKCGQEIWFGTSGPPSFLERWRTERSEDMCASNGGRGHEADR